MSAPLLGSFPFALWNMGTRTAAAEPEAARPERDSGGGSGGSSRSSGGSSLRVEGGRGGGRSETSVAAGESEGHAATGKSAPPVRTASSAVVLNSTRAAGAASRSSIGASGPAATTNPLGESTAKIGFEAASVPANEARGAPVVLRRAGGRLPASRSLDETDDTATLPPPPGPADGAGLVFGRGGQGQQQQQQQQQQQVLRSQECLLQEQELLRRENDVDGTFRFGLGGTQRWLDEDGGNSSGRASPPMGER